MIHHISGVILKAHPSKLNEVKIAVNAHDNTEIVQEDDYQLIVILEGSHANDIVNTLESIQQKSEVLDCTPIYHHFEEESELNSPLENTPCH
ncbi:chaperone NapD [Marinicellulosiphila megalodicopiae]|uniref:chaperone NapD n=1 Tax=Marinicellulosiphila megalodicopiae TaxID=2724896 RepID=UPI003BB032FD